MSERIFHDDRRETLDLVDAEDRVTGQISRDEALTRGLTNLRIVSLFIRNSEGQLLIPRRTAHKRIAPNGLDFSVSGYVQAGEGYDEAMASELEEEAGLRACEVDLRQLEVLSPHRHDIHGFMAVYTLASDRVPAYNPQDFTGWEWLSPLALVSRLQGGGESFKSDLLPVVRHCFRC